MVGLWVIVSIEPLRYLFVRKDESKQDLCISIQVNLPAFWALVSLREDQTV